jgi:hypothetical protein
VRRPARRLGDLRSAGALLAPEHGEHLRLLGVFVAEGTVDGCRWLFGQGSAKGSEGTVERADDVVFAVGWIVPGREQGLRGVAEGALACQRHTMFRMSAKDTELERVSEQSSTPLTSDGVISYRTRSIFCFSTMPAIYGAPR